VVRYSPQVGPAIVLRDSVTAASTPSGCPFRSAGQQVRKAVDTFRKSDQLCWQPASAAAEHRGAFGYPHHRARHVHARTANRAVVGPELAGLAEGMPCGRCWSQLAVSGDANAVEQPEHALARNTTTAIRRNALRHLAWHLPAPWLCHAFHDRPRRHAAQWCRTSLRVARWGRPAGGTRQGR
jgi:hypothetical protein